MNSLNHLLESGLSLHNTYPGLATLALALMKAVFVVSCASALALLLHRRSARARSWIWRGALLMLAMLAWWPLRPDMLRDVSLVVPVTVHAPVESYTMKPKLVTPPPAASSTAAAPATATSPKAIVVPKPPGWRVALRYADEQVLWWWLYGMATLMLWKIMRSVLGNAWLRHHARKPTDAIQALCPKELRCRVTDRVTAPLLTGLFVPTVWLPTEALEWNELKLRAAFQHELAHHKRWDVWWQWLGTLAACVWWWLPVGWFALRRMNQEAEHAADDWTVTQSLTVPDYAEALVEISKQAAAQPFSGALSISGYAVLERRVKALLSSNPWRDRMGWRASLTLAVAFLAMSSVVLVSCTPKKPVYVSLAKLVAGGRIVSNNASGPGYVDYLQDFYGTIIETLESATMKRVAQERVKALQPDLKECDVIVHVTQNKGSAIFNVSAVGDEPKYTRMFLDALLDEFRAFRDSIREQQRNKALTTLAEDVVKREASNKDKSEKLAAFKKKNNVTVLGVTQNQLSDRLTSLGKERLALEDRLSSLDEASKDARRALMLSTGTSLFALPGKDGQLTPGFSPLENALIRAQDEVQKLKAAAGSASDPRRMNAEIEVDQLTKELSVAVEQQIQRIKIRMDALAKKQEVLADEAGEATTKLADYERLQKDFTDSDNAYREMFDLVHKFQVNEDMSSDFVSIMERASPSVEDRR